MKILLIEDDLEISLFLKKGLAKETFLVETASDGKRGLLMAQTNAYNLIILDQCLPQLSGWEVIKILREKNYQTPIIMLTVCADINDKKTAYQLGADDYLTKPFLLDELILKIKALSKRASYKICQNLKLGDLILDEANGYFRRGHKQLDLTKREFLILNYLLKHQGEIISRGEILEKIWQYQADPRTNSIETHIASLRKKIKIKGRPDLIHTFSGRGYRLALKRLD
jgi:DNA-binding response OmpR family regulator